jgi:hypothetical protein
MFSSVIENFLFNGSSAKMMKGGAGAVAMDGSYSNGFLFFIIALAMFFIKVLLVMISYNIVVPRLLESYGNDMTKFRQLNFLEGIFLVILFNNLFSRF